MEINHKENMDMIKELNSSININDKDSKIKILSFIPVKYAYKEVSNDDMFNDILMFANMLKVKIIPVKRFGVAGLYSYKNIFVNVKSKCPLFYVIGHEISHMLEMRYVDYVWSMKNIVSKYVGDIGDIGDKDNKGNINKNNKYKKIIRYFKYLCKDYNFQYDRDDFNMLSLLFELVGDVLGELWLQYEFWELFKVDVSERLVELGDIGIEIVKKEKRVVSEWDSVLDMFCDLDGLRCEVVDVFRRNLEECVGEIDG